MFPGKHHNILKKLTLARLLHVRQSRTKMTHSPDDTETVMFLTLKGKSALVFPASAVYICVTFKDTVSSIGANIFP